MSQGEVSSTTVTRYLDARGIPYRFFRHTGEIHSLIEAANERGQRVEQIIRSIVFRLSHGGFVMVLIAGEQQVSWHALRRYLGTSRISMATEAEVLEVTGYPLGAVSPFGTKQTIRILVDKSVLLEQEISIGSGVRYTTVFMGQADFLHAIGDVEIGDFAEHDND